MVARRAVPDDAPELVRLRALMFGEFDGHDPTAEAWQPLAEQTLRERLAEPDPASSMAAFVVECPDRPDQPERLVACAIGIILQRLGGPENPSGRFGYVFNVVTEPGYRRRGYSRASLAALLDWYRARGVGAVDLHATGAGEPLYRDLGFARTDYPPMRLVNR